MRRIRKNPIVVLAAILLSVTLHGCGNTEPKLDSGPDFSGSPLQVSLLPPIRQILLVWAAVEGATHYRIFQDLNGESDGELDFVQISGDIPADDEPQFAVDVIVHQFDWANARFMLQSCVDAVCEEIGQQVVAGLSAVSIGSFVPQASGFNSAFGYAIDVSEAGDTIAIGAPGTSSFACEVIVPVETVENECEYDEDLTQEEIDALDLRETLLDAGAATILERVDGIWTEQAFIRAPNAEEGDFFGGDIALSDDGNLVVIAAPREDSNATGIDGDMDNNDAESAGAVYVYAREMQGDDFVWTEQAYIKASNSEGDADTEDALVDGDVFGTAIALSADGTVLVVSALQEDSAAMGVDGDQADNAAESAGAVYVFRNSMGTWMQEAYIKAANTGADDFFGASIAMNEAGDRFAVGAIGESSNAAGIDGDAFNDAAESAGAVYVFDWNGSAWAQQAYIKSSSPDATDEYGFSVSLNAAGDVLAVGAPQEDSNAVGVGGNPANDSRQNTGAAFLYEFGTAWAETEYFKASNPDDIDELGFTVKLNATGDFLLVTAIREGGNANGINGGQDLDFAIGSGAGYYFVRDAGDWEQQAYIKAATNGSGILFGWDADFGLDGDLLAISARGGSGVVFLH